MRRWVERIVTAWTRFWFRPVNLRRLGLFRCVQASVMVFMYTARHFDVKLFFSDQGLVPWSLVPQLLPEFYRPTWLWFPRSEVAIQGLHLFFIIMLVLLALGVLGRGLTWMVYLLHVIFVQRNLGAAYGADMINTFWLFYLSFTRHNQHFSILNYWRPARSGGNWWDPMCTVGYRLIQVQLCIIYLYSGLEKLKGELWWEGTALWNILANPQLSIADFTFMKDWPVVVSVLSYFAVLFETYFPVLIWIPQLTNSVLICGLLLHTGIFAVMGLFSFGAVMTAPYLLFWHYQQRRFHNRRRPFGRHRRPRRHWQASRS